MLAAKVNVRESSTPEEVRRALAEIEANLRDIVDTGKNVDFHSAYVNASLYRDGVRDALDGL